MYGTLIDLHLPNFASKNNHNVVQYTTHRWYGVELKAVSWVSHKRRHDANVQGSSTVDPLTAPMLLATMNYPPEI